MVRAINWIVKITIVIVARIIIPVKADPISIVRITSYTPGPVIIAIFVMGVIAVRIVPDSVV